MGTRQVRVVEASGRELEISSPGGFPSGVRLDNLLVTPPHPRSPLLADAFKRTGLVERTGRGINRMFAEQLRLDVLRPTTAEAPTRMSLQCFLEDPPICL